LKNGTYINVIKTIENTFGAFIANWITLATQHHYFSYL